MQDFFVILCNISAGGAIIYATMVGAMAKILEQVGIDGLVLRAGTDAEALGQLYELYYERIYRFCLCRLFHKETAEDVTSAVFLTVARSIPSFKGRTEADFRNWLYAIAANQANACIRKTSRRKQLFAEAIRLMKTHNSGGSSDSVELNWPVLYAAILKLKPKHQTIITLRFFENMEFEQIARVMNSRAATVRVAVHRILKKLQGHLQTVLDGEV